MTDENITALTAKVAAVDAAIDGQRLTAAELWRRAVLEGADTERDARAADARCLALESMRAEAAKHLAQAEARAEMIRSARLVAAVHKSDRPLSVEALAATTGMRPHVVRAVARRALEQKQIVRGPDGYARAA